MCLDEKSKRAIFESLLTILEASVIYWGSCDLVQTTMVKLSLFASVICNISSRTKYTQDKMATFFNMILYNYWLKDNSTSNEKKQYKSQSVWVFINQMKYV